MDIYPGMLLSFLRGKKGLITYVYHLLRSIVEHQALWIPETGN
jgi:hypothetical protein